MRIWQEDNTEPVQIVKTLEALEEAGTAGDVNAQEVRAAIEILRRLRARLETLERRSARNEGNLAAQQALLDDRLLKVERSRLFTIVNRIAARLTGFRSAPVSEKESDAAYAKWFASQQAGLPAPDEAVLTSKAWLRRPRISVLISLQDGASLPRVLESVGNQIYANWELCVATNRTNRETVSAAVCDFEKLYGPRACLVREFADAADLTKELSQLATGEYLAMIEEPGILSPWALYYVAEAAQSGAFDLVYSDEDAIDPAGHHIQPLFKPDWSPALLQSCAYLGRLAVVRRAFFQERGQLFDGRSWLDVIFQAAHEPLGVCHIPRVLYHRLRGAPPLSGPPANAHVGRSVSEPPRTDPMAVIVCSKSPKLLERCLKSVRETAGDMVGEIVVVAHEEFGVNAGLHSVAQRYGATSRSFLGRFNFSAMNNLGAAAARASNLLFLNDDVWATKPGWAEMLARQLSCKDVGAAGAVLWYPSGTLQHAGIAVGIHDGAGHVGRRIRSSALWPWLLVTREVSAVTGACFAVRKDVFQDLGGFDAGFSTNYNDVDLCLRMRERGYQIINVAAPGLIHAECQTRDGVIRFHERFRFYERWGDVLRRPDPYYSPSLSRTEKIALDFEEPWVGNVPIGRASGI